jgi:hypothetical protein
MPAALADVSSVTLSDGRQLIAWVTHHAQTREQGPAEPGATLAYRFIDGGKAGAVHVLSERAISIGGVKAIALPTGEHPKKNDAVAVLAWAGPNAGSSQVFVTKIGATGAKLLQKTVTAVTRKGAKDGAPPNEVFDIDIALTDKGNMVCTWSDTRDGNAEIYAARLDGNLQRRNADRRMTTTPGPSLEPAVVVVGEQILLAWSEAASDGAPAEVLFMPLDGGLEPSRQSARLLETATHSRGVQWVGTERGALALSWLEDGDGARFVALDDGGAVRGVPRKLTLSESAALSSLSMRCTARGCRGVVAASVSRQLLFGGFETTLDAGGAVRARSMAALTSGGADPALSSSVDVGSIFFVDNGEGVRLRALHLVW